MTDADITYLDEFDTAPQLIHQTDPVYPDLARMAELEGVIAVRVGIDASGRVREAKVVQGIEMLNDAAVACVSQWVSHPALRDGLPVAVHVVVPLRFTLPG